MKSLLLHAAEDGNVEQIQYILKDFINRIANEFDQTALHLAAKNGHSATVEELLKHGADPNVQDCNGNTPLHLVCQIEQDDMDDNEEEYSAIVDQLLKHPTTGVNIKINDQYQDAPLVLSLENKTPTIAQKLIEHGASVTDLNVNNSSALHLLAMNFSDQYERKKDLLDAILEHDDIDINQQDKQGFTAVHMACRHCPSKSLPQLIQHLLDSGAKSDIQTQENGTSLHYICFRNDADSFSKDDADTSVDLLFKANQDMLNHQTDKGWTPLHLAIINGNFNIALILLDYKEIDIHAKTSDAKLTALHMACMVQKKAISPLLVDVVKKLVAKGADLTAHDIDGDTPLHLACWTLARQNAANENTWDIAKYLLDQDGDHVHALNNRGLSPLMCAAEWDIPLNYIFQILTYTGGTILDCPWYLNNEETDDNEANEPKRKKSPSIATNLLKKQNKRRRVETSSGETNVVGTQSSPAPTERELRAMRGDADDRFSPS